MITECGWLWCHDDNNDDDENDDNDDNDDEDDDEENVDDDDAAGDLIHGKSKSPLGLEGVSPFTSKKPNVIFVADRFDSSGVRSGMYPSTRSAHYWVDTAGMF